MEATTMEAQIIDGKKVAKEIKAELKEKVEALKEKGVTPGLAAVLVGENRLISRRTN